MDLLDKYYKTEEENPKLTKSEDIVFSILDEMRGRRGMDGFGDCDSEIQEEILEALVKIVDEKL
jgi:hypothetical protein